MGLEKTKTADSSKLEALAKTFKERGWDGKIPHVLSQWGEFSCTGESFRLVLKKNDGEIVEVQVAPILAEMGELGRYIGTCAISHGRQGESLKLINAFTVGDLDLLITKKEESEPGFEFWLIVKDLQGNPSAIILSNGVILLNVK